LFNVYSEKKEKEISGKYRVFGRSKKKIIGFFSVAGKGPKKDH